MMYNIGAKIYKHFNKNNCNYLYALVTKYEKIYPCVFRLCENELYGELYGFPCVLYCIADFSKQDENIFFENYVDYMFRFDKDIDKKQFIDNELKCTVIDNIFYDIGFGIDEIFSYKDYVTHIEILTKLDMCKWMLSNKMVTNID